MKRRFFLLAAPAIVASTSLMKISVLKPIEPLIVGMDFGSADNACIVVGKTRMMWNGKMWVPAGVDIVHWSEIRPTEIKGYTPDAIATELERRVVNAKIHDYSVEAMRQRKDEAWLQEKLAKAV